MTSLNMWTDKKEIFPGIRLYSGIFKPEHNFIKRVEDFSSRPDVDWVDGTVGYGDKISHYRDCVDIKFGDIKIPRTQKQVENNKIWKDMYDAQINAVNDYSSDYNVKLEFWVVMNFIKYLPGQHFKEHADHGFSYSATVSLVGYPNDDYEGGGLTFPKLNISIKPKAGDLYIFPSTYLFSHVAEPVESGIKYSIVTMLDYNDHAHNDEFYEMRERRLKKK